MDQNIVKQFVSDLPVENSAAISLTRIKDDKKTGAKMFQIEFGQKLTDTKTKTQTGTNFVGMMQASNPAFGAGSSGCRRVWLNFGEPELHQYFPQIDKNAIAQLPMRTSSSAGPGIFIGQINPSVSHNGEEKFFRVRINEVFESNATKYELDNIEREAKKAGATGRFIKGMNPETNKVEHIFSRTEIAAAIKDTEGNFVNENGWKHIELDEYVSVDSPYAQSSEGVKFNTETGEIVNALPSLH
tara:strand:- start:352 stop:1080 length:729 start_codon:yes stop_codon:yes gene_type:complete